MAWYNPATWTPVDAVQDKLSQVKNAGNSFQGSSSNQVVFSNPYGLSAQNTQPAPQVKSAGGGNPNLPPPANPYRGGGGAGGGGGGGGPQNVNAADLANFDQGINNANFSLGLLDRQNTIGQENINNGYNSNLNKLLGSKAVADRNYNTSKTQSTQDNVNTRNGINASVGRNANALQRLLGQHGAGNSSAAQIVAPYGAALQGTQQLRTVADTFGKNMQALDTNYGDFNRNWDGSRADLDTQKYQQTNALGSDIATKRASLLSTLAQLQAQKRAAQGGNSAQALAAAQDYINQANNAQSQITELGRQYANPISVNAPTYAAPELSQYTYDQGTGPSVENNSAYTDTVSPFLNILLGKKQQQNQMV